MAIQSLKISSLSNEFSDLTPDDSMYMYSFTNESDDATYENSMYHLLTYLVI